MHTHLSRADTREGLRTGKVVLEEKKIFVILQKKKIPPKNLYAF